MKRIQLAVRDFALPVPRRGSIDVHSGYSYLPQSADEAHRQIQQKRGDADPDYQAEVKISHSFERGDFVFVVSGRIDGLIERSGNCPHLEEIKTAFNAKELYDKLVAEPQHPYRLQLLTYAYMYSLQNGMVPRATLLIGSYADAEDASAGTDTRGSTRRGEASLARSTVSDALQLQLAGTRDARLAGGLLHLEVLLDVAAYERWLDHRLDELVLEAEQRERDKKRRKAISKALRFPFASPRSGQLELIDTIERSLVAGESLLVQAPTGLGKTAGVIFPLLRDALRRGQKLVYVTPKNSQHQVAQEAIQQLRESVGDNKLHAISLTAKSKLCFKGEPICNPEHCEFAKDYYEKVAKHRLVDKVAEHPDMNAELFTKLGEQYEVCPFELSVDSLHKADVVIGDYNYVFAPVGLLGRLTGHMFGDTTKPNLAIDEAHNLPARACDYFSPCVSTIQLDACRERIDSLPVDLRAEAASLSKACLALITSHQPKGKQKQLQVKPRKDPFEALGQRLSAFLNDYLQVHPPKAGDPLVALTRNWLEFTEYLDREGEQFFCTYTADLHGVSLRITCCDASEHLSTCLKEFENVVAFSATLKPFDYYRQLSGFRAERAQTAEFTSPFPSDNRKLLVIPQVSTKFSDRAKNYDKIAQAIRRIVELRRGNYFVFFPSFSFLREVHERVQLPDFNVLQQKAGMTSVDVQKFIDTLRNPGEPTVIFAVQGGVFSEGVDFPGDSLIGALIVGPGLPGFDLERELMREYYEKKFGQGFDYAYTYPAMARVIQAAGRVIRSESDRGLIVLLDRRFTAPAYTATMPGDWFKSSVTELVSDSILKDISEFWTSGAKDEAS